MSNKANLLYREGYIAAFRDFKEHLEYSFSGFKSDRKRNNIQNVIWLIDGILENVDVFQQYGRDTPIYFEYDSKSKKCHYYVKMDEWPVRRQ